MSRFQGLFVFTLLGALSGCFASSTETEQPLSAETVPVLTPGRAKEALFDLMRSKSTGALKHFNMEEWSKVDMEAEEDGWYSFGGSFRVNPNLAVYSLTFGPRPGAGGCTFFYKGSFRIKNGRWVASPPEEEECLLDRGE